jgi:predicted dehydrogenase
MSPADLLARADIGAVLIVTDASSHYELAAVALSNNKHVFVEKPLATSMSECKALIAAATDTSRVLMVGHTFLYSEHVLAIKRALAGGLVGNIRYVHLQRLAYGRFRDDVNVIWNLGPHDVSILMHWAGKVPIAVRCFEQAFTRSHLSDIAYVTLDFGDFLGHVQLSCVDPTKVRRATIAGAKAGVVYDDVAGQTQLIPNGTTTPITISAGGARRPLDAEVDHFARSILTGVEPRTNGVHGAAVVAVLEGACASASAGGAWIGLTTPSSTKFEGTAPSVGLVSQNNGHFIEDYRAD